MAAYFTSIPGLITIVGLILLVLAARKSSLSMMHLETSDGVRTAMQILMTLLITGAALFIILSGDYSADSQKWAYGAIGTVLGFWLPSPK